MSDTPRPPGRDSPTQGSAAATGPVFEALPGRRVDLGDGTAVRRILPNRRRMVGPWCLVDHFGPLDVGRGPGMRVPPHPHIGIRTATWLVDGVVVHRDSLGSEQRILPGQLNLMTSGEGIAHSEESPPDRPAILHGTQLWAAMPDRERHAPPAFDHFPDPPTDSDGPVEVSVLLGDHAGSIAPAGDIGPIAALAVAIAPAGTTAPGRIPLDPAFEYGVLVLQGEAVIGGISLGVGAMLYLGTGRGELTLDAERPSRLLVLGGAPFDEPIVMWWNFVARSDAEIRAAYHDWTAGGRFGAVSGFDGDPLPAPELPAGDLRPR